MSFPVPCRRLRRDMTNADMTDTDGPILGWNGPMGLPRFERIASDDFAAAFDVALAADRAEIDAISADPGEPTFDNTVLALERSGRLRVRVSRLFRNLLAANADPVLEALRAEIARRLSRHASRTASDTALFARVDDLRRRRDELDLSPEQAHVLERTWTGFVRGGSRLDEADRDELADVLARLSALGAAFERNLLADERDWTLPVEDTDVLGTLPESLVSALRGARRGSAAASTGTSSRRPVPLMTPFLNLSAPTARSASGRSRAGPRAARAGGRDRQPPADSRDPRAARAARGPARLPVVRVVQARRPDGGHAGGRARAARARLGARRARRRRRRAGGALETRGRGRRGPPTSRRGTGPSSRRRCAASASISTRRRSRRTSRWTR